MKTLKFSRVKDAINPKEVIEEFKKNSIEINSLRINFHSIDVAFDETKYQDTDIANIINTIQGV